MSDPYKKVQPGDRLTIPAQAWNRVLDSVSIPVQTGGELAGLQPAPNTVLIKNSSGQDKQRFELLGVTGPLVNPHESPTHESDFLRRPALVGVTVNATHFERFVVCLEPIKNNAVGVAAVSGVFPCRVELRSVQHRFAVPSSSGLVSSSCGPVALLWVGATGVTGTNEFPGSTGPTGTGKFAVGAM